MKTKLLLILLLTCKPYQASEVASWGDAQVFLNASVGTITVTDKDGTPHKVLVHTIKPVPPKSESIGLAKSIVFVNPALSWKYIIFSFEFNNSTFTCVNSRDGEQAGEGGKIEVNANQCVRSPSNELRDFAEICKRQGNVLIAGEVDMEGSALNDFACVVGKNTFAAKCVLNADFVSAGESMEQKLLDAFDNPTSFPSDCVDVLSPPKDDTKLKDITVTFRNNKEFSYKHITVDIMTGEGVLVSGWKDIWKLEQNNHKKLYTTDLDTIFDKCRTCTALTFRLSGDKLFEHLISGRKLRVTRHKGIWQGLFDAKIAEFTFDLAKIKRDGMLCVNYKNEDEGKENWVVNNPCVGNEDLVITFGVRGGG